MKRRTFLGLAGLGAAAASVPVLSGCADSPAGQSATLLSSDCRLPARYQAPLPVPPVKQPLSRTGGVTSYEITQRSAEVELLPGMRTTVMGYDGIFPGPTIEARRGERVVIRHRNLLTVPTVVHLHGGNTAPRDDGYPVDLLLPDDWHHDQGDSSGHLARGARDYHYDHDQQAATLWYHDHRMDFTGPQVWRGLAGLHLIRDDVEDRLPLPAGDREVGLVITDRAFDAEGGLKYPALQPDLIDTPGVTESYASGVLGDVILVNGAPWPEFEVDAARYRFRILNASNGRRYQLELDPPPPGGRSFTMIGSDAGLLARPAPLESITTAAAERHDVIIDFARYPVGSLVVLANRLGNGSTATVMRFRVARRATDDSRIPRTLAEIEPVDTTHAVHREWRFTRQESGGMAMWAINGRYFDPERMDARPRLGRTEVWRFYTDLNHSVHVHLSPFRVISRSGHRPAPAESGWKDTLDLRPTEYADVAVRFTGHRGRYLMHCHNLEHEDMGMMSAFEVV